MSLYPQRWLISHLPRGKGGKKSVLTDTHPLRKAEVSYKVPQQQTFKRKEFSAEKGCYCTFKLAKDALILGNRFFLENNYITQNNVTHF